MWIVTEKKNYFALDLLFNKYIFFFFFQCRKFYWSQVWNTQKQINALDKNQWPETIVPKICSDKTDQTKRFFVFHQIKKQKRVLYVYQEREIVFCAEDDGIRGWKTAWDHVIKPKSDAIGSRPHRRRQLLLDVDPEKLPQTHVFLNSLEPKPLPFWPKSLSRQFSLSLSVFPKSLCPSFSVFPNSLQLSLSPMLVVGQQMIKPSIFSSLGLHNLGGFQERNGPLVLIGPKRKIGSVIVYWS